VHISDVLRGSSNQRVRKFGHDKLSTHGIGGDYTKKQWVALGRQLIQKGLLDREVRYGGLRFTPKAMQFLKSGEKLYGVMGPRRQVAAHGMGAGGLEYERPLFDALRALRKRLADEAGLPPYLIFHDQTLVEMAAYYPHSLESLGAIYGVGRVKLEKYGAPFLEVIQSYCAEHGLQERPKTVAKPAPTIPGKRRHHQVGEMYNQGQTAQEIAASLGIKHSTVINHLYKYSIEGNALRSDASLLALVRAPEEQQQRALRAFDELGTQYLSPVFNALQGQVSYADLHVLRLHYLCR
jgi:ATP-dependent DNA helicase RecQ